MKSFTIIASLLVLIRPEDDCSKSPIAEKCENKGDSDVCAGLFADPANCADEKYSFFLDGCYKTCKMCCKDEHFNCDDDPHSPEIYNCTTSERFIVRFLVNELVPCVSMQIDWRTFVSFSSLLTYTPFDRYISYHGFCIRPYLFAGSNVTVVFLDDVNIEEIPKPFDLNEYDDDLTLLTHSSASALDSKYLTTLLKTWQGPISLAVFLQHGYNADYVKNQIIRSIEALPDKSVVRGLAVHVMHEKREGQSCLESETTLTKTKTNETLTKKKTNEMFVADYPINTMRNVARLFSSSQYIAMADSDYIFSYGFYQKMLPLVRKEVHIGSKQALLYRIFEIEEQSVIEKNYELKKSDLRQIIKDDKGRVFHVKKWSGGHSVPRLKEWLNEVESDHPSIFDLQITNLTKRPYWEFQFVTLRDVPLFDEDFPYRADNNLELRWEVCRAGYELRLVQDLFVYHTLNDDVHKYDPKKKHSIKQKNLAKFKAAKSKLIKRMARLYSNTTDRCPV